MLTFRIPHSRRLALAGLFIFCIIWQISVLNVSWMDQDILRIRSTALTLRNIAVGNALIPSDENNSIFNKWRNNSLILNADLCPSGSMIFIYDVIAVITECILDKSKLMGGGGALTVDDARNQTQGLESYELDSGAFANGCKIASRTQQPRKFKLITKLNHFLGPIDKNRSANVTVRNYTILIKRIEYANIYWTLQDIYNVFLTCAFLKLNPQDVNILLFDAHAYGMLDTFWDLFGHVYRVHQLETVTKFENLVLSPWREHGPLLDIDTPRPIPLIDQFKPFIHSMHGEPVRPFDRARCSSGEYRILFIWRHEYGSRPNANVTVQRKIANEKELLTKTREAFRSARVHGLQIDQLTLADQLRWIGDTDILIGMHGAALAFSLLQPSGAALIELFPGLNWHMSHFASVNSVHYVAAREDLNIPPHHEIPRVIKPDRMQILIAAAIERICRIPRRTYP